MRLSRKPTPYTVDLGDEESVVVYIKNPPASFVLDNGGMFDGLDSDDSSVQARAAAQMLSAFIVDASGAQEWADADAVIADVDLDIMLELVKAVTATLKPSEGDADFPLPSVQ